MKSNITTSNLTQDVLHLDHIYSTSIILKEETVNTMNECEEDIKFKVKIYLARYATASIYFLLLQIFHINSY